MKAIHKYTSLACGLCLSACASEDLDQPVMLRFGVSDGRSVSFLTAGEGTTNSDAFSLSSVTIISGSGSLEFPGEIAVSPSSFPNLSFAGLTIQQDIAATPLAPDYTYSTNSVTINNNTTGIPSLLNVPLMSPEGSAVYVTDVIGTLAGNSATVIFAIRVELPGVATSSTQDNNAVLAASVAPTFVDAPYLISGAYMLPDSFQAGGGLTMSVRDAVSGANVGPSVSVTIGQSPAAATAITDANGQVFFAATQAPLDQDVPSWPVTVNGAEFTLAASGGSRCQECALGPTPMPSGAPNQSPPPTCPAGWLLRGNNFGGYICARFQNAGTTCFNPFYGSCSQYACDPARTTNTSPTGWCTY